MLEKIKKWYKLGLWNESKIQDAVSKGVITEDQAREILENV